MRREYYPFAMLRFLTRRAVPALVLASFVTACDRVSRLSDHLLDRRTPRQRYLDGLERAGLTTTAVFLDWATAGERALTDAPLVTTPHFEEVDLPPTVPAAIGLRIELRRGQEVRFEVALLADTTVAIFLEAWHAGDQTDSVVRVVAESKEGERFLTFEPRADGEYLFRAQPELLRGGRFSVALQVAPTLAFPIQGGHERDIGSRWGAVRDGGRRSHTGIDIFARRGTPVLAAGAGRVVEVGVNELGGNVVWIRDERGNAHYYAHLSDQLVGDGQVVARGDTVGLVGNTGNARTTPPHLHFGVYRPGEGSLDPFWFIHQPRGVAPRLSADTSLLGDVALVSTANVVVRTGPGNDADTLARVSKNDSLEVLAASGAWFRVRLRDGVTGFLASRHARRVRNEAVEGARGTGVATAQ